MLVQFAQQGCRQPPSKTHLLSFSAEQNANLLQVCSGKSCHSHKMMSLVKMEDSCWFLACASAGGVFQIKAPHYNTHGGCNMSQQNFDAG